MKTTGMVQTSIHDDIFVPCLTPDFPQTEARVSYIHDKYVIDDREGVDLPTIFAIAISM